MNLFQYGKFVLNSGRISELKIECDTLEEKDIETLAWMISKIVKPFVSVEGIPKGGLRLAKALEKYKIPGAWNAHLIVDDVLTTGNSMLNARDEYNIMEPVIGAVIFARGKCPTWIRPLFPLPEELWNL